MPDDNDRTARATKRTRIEELIHEELERPSSHSSHFDTQDEKAAKKPHEKRITDLLAENLREQLILKGYSVPVPPGGNGATARPTEFLPAISSTEISEPMEGDLPKLSLHPSFFVGGVKIGWPFPVVMKPQRQMAMHLITALKSSKHVVIESPTGTGKSAAILCSILAWQRYHAKMEGTAAERPCKVIYCSRTHSQVAQMVASLRKTPYRPRMAILGSRKLLCINKKVVEGGSMDKECRVRVKNTEKRRRYMFKSNHEFYDDENPPTLPLDDSSEIQNPAPAIAGETDNEDDGMLRRLPKRACCSYYQQIGTKRTAALACKSFVPSRSAKHGGDMSKHGTHDVEDLVLFGKNPHRRRGIAVYRSPDEPFGMTLVEHNKRIHIGAIRKQSPAEASGALKVGDEILTINGSAALSSVDRTARQVGQTPRDKPLLLDITSSTDDVLRNDDDTDEIYSEHAPCPYFLSRGLAKDAELVFCPYNYVLDPVIREALGLSLWNTVVVLDEAHNVEDTLRESGSGIFSEFELAEMVAMLLEFIPNIPSNAMDSDVKQLSDWAHEALLVVESLLRFLIGSKVNFERFKAASVLEEWRKFRTPDDTEFEMTFDGPTGHGVKGKAVGCATFLQKLDTVFCGEQLRLNSAEFVKKVHSFDDWRTDTFGGLLNRLSEMTTILSYAAKYSEHYYIASVVKGNGSLEFASREETEADASPTLSNKKHQRLPKLETVKSCCRHPHCQANVSGPDFLDGAIRHGEYCTGDQPRWEASLRFELLTPAPLFKDLRGMCRTVVLASGSLAPIPSLCTELGLVGSTVSAKEQSPLASSSFKTTASESVKEERTKEIPGTQISSHPLEGDSVLDLDEHLRSTRLDAEMSGPRLQIMPKPLEADHIIDLEKQLLVVSCGVFTNGSPLTATYQNWRQDSFIGNLGNAIATVIESIPSGGVLVFLPSYATLKKCVIRWQSQQDTKGWQVTERSLVESTIWERLVASKGKVIVEPTGSQNDFELAREEYAHTISTTGSCVLLAVFRGKMSEGISFNDENARGVICVGVPFPHAFSRPITAKKAYNDEQRRVHKRMEVLSGSEWYAQQAFRAIAQALGRCIRHASDYGTIVLMDSRHCDVGGPREGDLCQAHLRLPKWMRHHVKNLTMRNNADACTKSIHGGWAGLQQEMKRFFTEAPIHAQHVRDEQAIHLIKSQAQSSGSHQFDVKTGSWTLTVPIAPDATHLEVSQDSVPNVHSIFALQTPTRYHSPEPEAHVNKEAKMVT